MKSCAVSRHLRKDADFNIEDKIMVRYVASERLNKAIKQFADYIQTETLSNTLEADEPNDGSSIPKTSLSMAKPCRWV